MNIMLSKKCSKCCLTQELNAFVKNRNNKDGLQNHCNLCRKKYRELKKIDRCLYNKEYRKINSEKIKKDRANWYLSRPNYNKKYYERNIEKINKYKNEWDKNKQKVDAVYKLKRKIRLLIKDSFRDKKYSKNIKTINILGCSVIEFKLHIESMFESWMNWDNHGKYNGKLNFGWDYDHIIPISTAKTIEDVIRLNHYTNLQPLCSKVNRDIKKANLNWK